MTNDKSAFAGQLGLVVRPARVEDAVVVLVYDLPYPVVFWPGELRALAPGEVLEVFGK